VGQSLQRKHEWSYSANFAKVKTDLHRDELQLRQPFREVEGTARGEREGRGERDVKRRL